MAFTSPLVMVIFGATGDLMHRKLMPAVYHLVKDGEVSPKLNIIGVGRRDITSDLFRDLMVKSVREMLPGQFDEKVWNKFERGIHYICGQFEDDSLYADLTKLLKDIDTKQDACIPRFFYLATPPQHYETILTHMKLSKLSDGCGQGTSLYTRLLIEKPFGRDLDTAKHLDELLGTIFEERQIYRIDHYLGKETVQNLLGFRFANGMFEPTWNSAFIDHVQITLAENTGVGKRGAFYDGVGAIRDVVQNHMLEMLALVAMEQPRAFDSTSIRDQRVKAIESIRCIKPSEVSRQVIRGQYDRYIKEPGVDPHSNTETFIALKLFLDTKRWNGVPFYFRTGKMLEDKVTEISIHYKKPVVCMGDACLFPEDSVLRNVLSIRIEPEEGITLRLMVKEPGFGMKLTPVQMRYAYSSSFGMKLQPSPYERLLLDAVHGDQTLFSRTDGISASWKFVTNILSGFTSSASVLHPYVPGSWGPQAAHTFIEKDNRHWFLEGNGVE